MQLVNQPEDNPFVADPEEIIDAAPFEMGIDEDEEEDSDSDIEID